MFIVSKKHGTYRNLVSPFLRSLPSQLPKSSINLSCSSTYSLPKTSATHNHSTNSRARSLKNSNPAPLAMYCHTCGRLISPNHRNFSERKHCSKTCSSTRLNSIDKQLEEMFIALAKQKSEVACGEVETDFVRNDQSPSTPSQQQMAQADADQDPQKLGMQKAKWRERVRRAGRRVVAFPQGDDRFECIQDGKAVEPSFAKGEWYVRLIKQ